MNISKILTKTFLTFSVLMILLFAANITWAQTDATPKKRLNSPSGVNGVVGGEAHDSYVINVRKGKTLTVRISWKGGGDKKAQFVVSKSDNFFSGDVVEGGRETYDGKNWWIKVPATGDYYIYVTSHPTAEYTLKVMVR